jgi:uncharacterized membrane protein
MRNNKWLIGALVVSVIVNLLLAGFVIGRLSGIGPPPPFGPDPAAGFVRLLGFLDDDCRAGITPVLRPHLGAMLPMLRTVRRDQHAVIEALTAEPFVPEALERSLGGLRAHLTAVQVASHESFVAMASLLTVAERKALAEAMRHPPHKHRRQGMSEGRDGPPLGVQPGRGGIDSPQEVR